MPEVSVVVPTYNRAHLLARAIQSVLTQTFADLELIIVDDCSIDNTREILRSWSDKRVRTIRHDKNRGAPAARNTGIFNAQGRFIAFLDSDNELLPRKLERQVELFRKSPETVGVVYARNTVVNEVKNEIGHWDFNLRGNLYFDFLKGPFLDFITALIKRECFDRIGLMDENVLAYQEWDTFLRISRYYEFDFVPEILAVYHIHRGETISKNLVHSVAGYNYIVKKQRNEVIRNVGRKALSAHYNALFHYYRAAKEYRGLCRAFFLTFYYSPRRIAIVGINRCIGALLRIRSILEA
jgi:glycosyltransferase involved in cell wall biosynthesis